MFLGVEASGHGSAHEQILKISEAIEDAPEDAKLYLQRADLYLAHQYPEPALQDYQKSLQLEPELISAKLGLGTIYLNQGEFKLALKFLDEYVQKVDDDSRAWINLARTYYSLGDFEKSIRHYDNAIQHTPNPRPEWFLEQAQTAVECHWGAGDEEQIKKAYQAAVKKIDAGIAKLGSAITLEMAALEYERLSGQYEMAIARVDRLMGQARRKESWWIRKGDILRDAGQIESSQAAYESALEAIQQLSESRQQLKSVMSMSNYAQEQIAAIKN